MLAILDYKAGNQTSVLRALNHLNIPAVITDNPDTIRESEGIIFPGVGSAGQAMEQLRNTGLDLVLKEACARKQPVLGICLGCQILLEKSEEHQTTTLGILPGTCKLFDSGMKQPDGTPAPVPHMGWNTLTVKKDSPLFAGIPADAQFYFVHSYYTVPAPELVLATTNYGIDFCSVYGRDGLWAVQFHPEKSGRFGLTLLKNFSMYCKGAGHAC